MDVHNQADLCMILSYLSCIQELPSTIGQLKALTNLNVDKNRLNDLPAEV
jgi:Leucine-rich repeat (LRR) protein